MNETAPFPSLRLASSIASRLARVHRSTPQAPHPPRGSFSPSRPKGEPDHAHMYHVVGCTEGGSPRQKGGMTSSPSRAGDQKTAISSPTAHCLYTTLGGAPPYTHAADSPTPCRYASAFERANQNNTVNGIIHTSTELRLCIPPNPFYRIPSRHLCHAFPPSAHSTCLLLQNTISHACPATRQHPTPSPTSEQVFIIDLEPSRKPVAHVRTSVPLTCPSPCPMFSPPHTPEE